MNGSQTSVAQILQRKPIVCYFTGRSSSTKRATYDWIRENGFPESEIFFQPDTVELSKMGFGSGNEWRAKLLEFLFPYIESIVDDNEELLDYIRGYQGTIYLLGKSGQSQRPNVFHCPDWSSVVEEISLK